MESDLPTLDPLGMASFSDRNAGLLLYDTLLDIDAKGNIVPNIAERIDASEDVMSFKLTLRSGVKFSDGTPYDAAAVVKNFQRIMDPKNRCRCVSDLSHHRHGRGHRAARSHHQDEVAVGALPGNARRRRRHGRSRPRPSRSTAPISATTASAPAPSS